MEYDLRMMRILKPTSALLLLLLLQGLLLLRSEDTQCSIRFLHSVREVDCGVLQYNVSCPGITENRIVLTWRYQDHGRVREPITHFLMWDFVFSPAHIVSIF